jgi:hypothetical protein
VRGDSALGSPFPLTGCFFPWDGERVLGPTEEIAKALLFSRSFINQNRPCHKKQGPFPQKYDFAKRKSCWLREGTCGGKFLYSSFFLFFLVFFFISLCCFFFVTVGFCFIFYKTLALKDSNTIQTAATNPHP